ncbi:hypothetical protein MBLNU13_g02792t1 [Cladosporium sp. NU13]
MGSSFSDTESVTSMDSMSAANSPTVMASPFSDTESITSIESSKLVWSTNPLISNASSRTSLDSLDDDDDALYGLSPEEIRQVTQNMQEITANFDAAMEAHTEISSALGRIGEGLEAINAGLRDLTAAAEASLENSRQVVETTARVEMQPPAFIERPRATAETEARRDARPGFFGSFVNQVKERFWGWVV